MIGAVDSAALDLLASALPSYITLEANYNKYEMIEPIRMAPLLAWHHTMASIWLTITRETLWLI